MFILGVLVGRGTAPLHFETENIQKELAALRDAVIKKDRAMLEAKTGDGFKKTDLGFYEDLKKTDNKHYRDTRVADNLQPEKKTQSLESMKKKSLSVKKAKDPKTQAGKTGPSTVKEKEGRPEIPILKNRYTIQVASLKDPKAADVIVKQLKIRGYPAYRVKTDIKDKGTWYRVRIGAYQTRKTAEPVVKKLRNENQKPIIIAN